jgi:cellulose synthase/poly-beta-1,6-N-acetylglucosamine synthase-like glycosyltransferase
MLSPELLPLEEKAWFQMLMSGRERFTVVCATHGKLPIVRRSVLEEMGGWDANSLTEDVELALRLVEKDHLIKYAPDVCCGQETPTVLKSLVKQRVRWYRGYMETALKYGRLLDHINKRTLDAEVSLAGPFMMVVSLLSYINWFIVAVFLSQSTPVLNFTGLVIALTAVSLSSIAVGLIATRETHQTSKHFVDDPLNLCLQAAADGDCRLGIPQTGFQKQKRLD